MGMGNNDIDSIGRYANAYDGSRVRFFAPSEFLTFDKLIVITPSFNLLLLNLSLSFIGIFLIKYLQVYLKYFLYCRCLLFFCGFYLLKL